MFKESLIESIVLASLSFFLQDSIFLSAGIAGYAKFKKCCLAEKMMAPEGLRLKSNNPVLNCLATEGNLP